MSDPTPQPNAAAGTKNAWYALRKENAQGHPFHWILMKY